MIFDESMLLNQPEDTDEVINFDEIEESVDCLSGLDEDFNAIEGALEIACLAEANYNKFVDATCRMEIASLIAEGTTAIYEENETKKGSAKEKINSWFKAAKGLVMKWASYVKAFFKKAFAMIESLFASDAKFVKDNGNRIMRAANSEGLKFTGYKFTVDEIVYLGEGAWSADIIDVDKFTKDNYESVKSTLTDDVENKLKAARSKLAKSGNDLTDKEFKDELFKKFRNGESKKTELTVATAYGNASGAVAVISKSADAKAKANKDYDAEQKSIKKAIKAINDMKKAIERKDEDRDLKMKAANKSIDYLRKILKIENVAHGIHLQAIKADNRQARAVCSQILLKNVKVGTKGKGANSEWTSKNESTDMTTSYLDGLDY